MKYITEREERMRKSSFYLLVVLLVGLFSLNNTVVSAETISDVNEKIRQLEKEKNEVNSKSNELNKNKKEVNKKMDSNKEKQSSVETKINNIEEDLASTQADIQAVTANITSTEKEIEELESEIKQLHIEIEELELRIEERNELLKDRLRSIQESGGKSQFISVLLGSQNFSDFIVRSTAVNTIMDQDRNIMEEHEQDQLALERKKEEVESKKANVELKKVELEGQRSKLEALKVQLDDQKAEQKKLKKELQAEYADLEEVELSLDEEQALMAAEAAVIEQAKNLAVQEKKRLEQEAERQRQEEAERQRKEAERQKQAAQSNSSGKSSNQSTNNQQVSVSPPPVASGSGFIRPVGGRVSSEYGWRTHPISGTRKFHNGIDLAGNNGYAVSAANSGVVAHAGWMGGYGNTVMISHGSVTTLYAHLSSISVKSGQSVGRGTKIGNVGSTGNSTGPHLHFEVHPNGYGKGTANPRNYVNF